MVSRMGSALKAVGWKLWWSVEAEASLGKTCFRTSASTETSMCDSFANLLSTGVGSVFSSRGGTMDSPGGGTGWGGGVISASFSNAFARNSPRERKL